MATTKEMMGHPMATLTILALIAGGITAIGTISGAYDAGHTSQTELDVVVSAMNEISLESKCRALNIQISLVESAIWQMDQVEGSSQRLVEKRRELRRLQAQYNEAHCATVLAES
jgi:hypothetical protein